jgi:hypothetical protein
MSSSTLTTIQAQLNLYGFSIILILGNIGNIFIVILFSRQRRHACSIYLISAAIMNDIYLTFNSFIEIFPFYYADETIGKFALCKIRYYLPSIIAQGARTMLILACIDRFLITDDRASFRAFSTPKRAKWFIFLAIIFWSLLGIHFPIMVTIVNGQCGTFGIYSTVYTFYTIIFVGLIPPITMGVFGYLTYRNLTQRHNRVQPVGHNTNDVNNNIQRRDRDLLIIVLSEVFVYVITTILYPLVYLEIMISRYIIPNKSVQYSQIEGFIITIMFLVLLMNNAAPFYIYLISSKSFRRDFKQLIMKSYRKLRRQTPVQIVPRTHQTIIRQEARV